MMKKTIGLFFLLHCTSSYTASSLHQPLTDKQFKAFLMIALSCHNPTKYPPQDTAYFLATLSEEDLQTQDWMGIVKGRGGMVPSSYRLTIEEYRNVCNPRKKRKTGS